MAANVAFKSKSKSVLEFRKDEVVEAGRLLFLPLQEVKGVKLCVRGRVYRAFDVANAAPKEQWPEIEKVIKTLSEQADAALAKYKTGMEAYENACKFANQEPELIDFPQCNCIGCAGLQEAMNLIESLEIEEL